jgi:hypothetical protein
MPIHIDLEKGLTESPFDPAMFMEGGWLYEQPLNHAIRLQPAGCRYSMLVNAGYFANNFLESDRQGYEALREVIRLAKEEANSTYQIKNRADSAKKVQAQGTTNPERSVCGTSGDDSKGE